LPARGSDVVLTDVLELAANLKRQAEGRCVAVSAVGLGLCELVGPDGEVLSANLLDWRTVSLRQRLSSIAPAVVEADVRAAALAEARFGAGRSLRCFLYVTIGTGISCCLVVDGKPYAGARGAAGTMASSPWMLRCEHCGNLDERTLEELASGPGLAASYNRVAREPLATAEAVLSAAAAGDAVAKKVVASGAEALGTSIRLLVNVLDPEAVILGGGLGLSRGWYQGLTASARAHVWWEGHRNLPVFHAQTGEDAGLIGAAVAAAEVAAGT
jgi:glucokinase